VNRRPRGAAGATWHGLDFRAARPPARKVRAEF